MGILSYFHFSLIVNLQWIYLHMFVHVLHMKLLAPYTYCQTALQKIHSNLLSHQQHYNHNPKQSIKIIFCPFIFSKKDKSLKKQWWFLFFEFLILSQVVRLNIFYMFTGHFFLWLSSLFICLLVVYNINKITNRKTYKKNILVTSSSGGSSSLKIITEV